MAVALLGRLRRGAEQVTDALPRDAVGSGGGDGADHLSFAASSGEGGTFEEVLLDGAFVAWAGFE